MNIFVLSAAKRVGQRSEWSLDHLDLQKILYLAHMFYLGTTHTPLFISHFNAWKYGPISPTLYYRIKMFGSDSVTNVFSDVPTISDSNVTYILDRAYDILGNLGSGKLVAATQRHDGAWAKNYVPGGKETGYLDNIIPNDDIFDEFQLRSSLA